MAITQVRRTKEEDLLVTRVAAGSGYIVEC